MKIDSELERILRAQQQQQSQTVKTKSANSTAFEDILQSAMQEPDATRLDEGISLANLERSPQNMRIEAEDIERLQASEENTSTNPRQALLNEIDNSLSSLDMYTQSIQSQNASHNLMKQAWQGLMAFSQSVNDLRQNYANLSEQDSSLDAMINDLEIMAVTETYKFNRGDYSL